MAVAAASLGGGRASPTAIGFFFDCGKIIRAHVEEPIALHEVAAAASCSVRSLQLAFRSFRNTTPLLAIRRFRLEAAREALRSGNAGGTITEVALRFGFANPGRFTRHYKEAFGETPAEAMGRRRP